MSDTSKPQGPDADEQAQVRKWVAAAQAGDEAAFGELVRMYQTRVQSVAYGVVRHEQDARELAQQAWVKAWQNLRGFHGQAQFYTWLYRIVSNLCLDFLRRKTRHREEATLGPTDLPEDRQPALADAPDHTPAAALQQAEVREAFERALQTLRPEHRVVLTLREVEGLSYDEIARVTGCLKGTVMSRLFYARQQMRVRLKEWQ